MGGKWIVGSVRSEDQFWSLFDMNGPLPKDPGLGNCWLWTGSYGKKGFGYGTVSYQGKPWLVHRLAFALINGDPGTLLVLHKCDVPRCGNPIHLFSGTQSDNLQDAYRKGRATMPVLRGAAHPLYGKRFGINLKPPSDAVWQRRADAIRQSWATGKLSKRRKRGKEIAGS